jgi:hypothetical protein
VDGVQSHVWPAAEISRSFYFETELRYVPLPGLMAEEQARQQQADLQAQLERDRFYTERERLQAELRAARSAGEWQERRLQEMNRDVLAQAQRQKEELVDGFLRDIVVQLRTLVYQATTDVLAAIQKNEGLPPRSVAQLNNLVRQVQALNFYGDEDVEAMVNKIAFTLGQQAPARDVFSFEQNLRDIATVVRASLVSLGEQPRGARMLGVADEPTPDVVRRARRSLELERGSADTLDLGAPAFRQPRLLELAAG